MFGVVLGWGLSQTTKIWDDRKQDKRKLKKLLFYLLELRYSISKDLNLQKDINEFYLRFTDKIKKQFGEEVALEASSSKLLCQKIMKEHLITNNSLDYLEQNIDSVINDLAEVLPVFAYELNGKYNIKSRLKVIDSSIKQIEEYITEAPPFDLKEWIEPKVTNNLLRDLDKNIKQIALKIGRKTWKNIDSKIKEMDKKDYSDLDSYIDEIIEKIKTNNL